MRNNFSSGDAAAGLGLGQGEGRTEEAEGAGKPKDGTAALAGATISGGGALEDESISGLAGRNTLPCGAAQKKLEEVARVCWNVSVCSCTTVCK